MTWRPSRAASAAVRCRAAAQARLDDDHAGRHRGDQPVADEEAVLGRDGPRRVLADHEAAGGHPGEQGLVRRGVGAVDAARHDGDRRPLDAQRPAVRRAVDPDRGTGDHGVARARPPRPRAPPRRAARRGCTPASPRSRRPARTARRAGRALGPTARAGRRAPASALSANALKGHCGHSSCSGVSSRAPHAAAAAMSAAARSAARRARGLPVDRRRDLSPAHPRGRRDGPELLDEPGQRGRGRLGDAQEVGPREQHLVRHRRGTGDPDTGDPGTGCAALLMLPAGRGSTARSPRRRGRDAPARRGRRASTRPARRGRRRGP